MIGGVIMKKKVTFLALSVVMAVSTLVGCGNSKNNKVETSNTDVATPGATSEATKTEEKNEPVTLRFSWWGGDARHEATLKVIQQFQELYPWITIEPEYSAFDGYAEKKMTEFASGAAPDIFQIETGSGPTYCEQGVLANITELGFNFSNFDDAFLKANGEFGTGSRYAIPVSQAGSALVVNKTLADKIGVDFTQPYNWEDLIEMGKKVQAYDSETYLLSVNTRFGAAFMIRSWCRQMNNKALIDKDLNLNMTEEQFAECFTFIKSLYDNKVCAPASYKASFGEADQEDPNWIAGKYVADICYTSTAEVLQAANNSVEYIAGNLPLRKDGASDGWFNDCSGYMGIYAQSKHKEEAAMFLDYFFNNETAIKTLGTVRSVPPTTWAQDICEAEGSLNPLTKAAVKVSMQYNGTSDSGKTTTSEVEAILNDAYENISYGAKTPEQQAKEIVALLKDYIALQK